jgi:hypothetical protein
MAGTTPTQSIRFAELADVESHTVLANLADDVATQLDAADVARTHGLKTPVAKAERNAALNIPVSTITTVPMDQIDGDTHGMINLGSFPNRITVSASAGAGLYQIEAFGVTVDTTGWTRGTIHIRKNGAAFYSKSLFKPVSFVGLNTEITVNLAVADYIEIAVEHEGGGTTQWLGGGFSLMKVSD